MSHGILLSLLLVALVSTAAAAPGILDLSSAIKRTICPTEIKLDIDPDRIPRTIKTIRCKENPDNVCQAMRKPEECCRWHDTSGVKSECVDVMDGVLVASKEDLSKIYTITVPVGCECILRGSTFAKDA